VDTPENTFLVTADAAKFIHVAAGTLPIWRTTKRYNLPYIKCGRKVLYRKSDLIAFLESRRIMPGTAAEERA